MSTELIEKYSFKLKSPQDLRTIIGPFPRDKKVIMCHGVFDVVHPGHIRHLAYAKSKAGILVASITADRHITKGTLRPHVPERLRALNLAAFEMVDYVIIDNNAKPLENLAYLQPDFFAKGFEYVGGGLPPATQEEVDVVDAYGGQTMFTPGDVVYSSSQLINLAAPNLKIDKLLSLFHTHDISFNDLRSALTKMEGFKAHIVGDTIIDSYTRTSLIGGQTKTPTFSVRYIDQENYVGGAGIVSQHMQAAGAEVTFSTVLGKDELANFTMEQMDRSGVRCNAIFDDTRPTTNKNAIIADGYRLLKIDTLDNRSISEPILDQLVASLKETAADSVIFSDFRHGIFNQLTTPVLTDAIPDGTFRVADSQVASRWGNITEFKGFDLITPNEREARFALADQDSTVGRLAGAVLAETKARMLLLKLGNRGVFVLTEGTADGLGEHFSIDSFANNVVDAVGAGDAMLAYGTLAMLATQSPVIASVLGSMAAACECEYDGNIPVQPRDILTKIDEIEMSASYTQ